MIVVNKPVMLMAILGKKMYRPNSNAKPCCSGMLVLGDVIKVEDIIIHFVTCCKPSTICTIFQEVSKITIAMLIIHATQTTQMLSYLALGRRQTRYYFSKQRKLAFRPLSDSLLYISHENQRF